MSEDSCSYPMHPKDGDSCSSTEFEADPRADHNRPYTRATDEESLFQAISSGNEMHLRNYLSKRPSLDLLIQVDPSTGLNAVQTAAVKDSFGMLRAVIEHEEVSFFNLSCYFRGDPKALSGISSTIEARGTMDSLPSTTPASLAILRSWTI